MLRKSILGLACACLLSGCATAGGDLSGAAGDVKAVTKAIAKTAPDALSEVSAIGKAAFTVLDDLAKLAKIGPQVGF